jgi:hypothetical protein
MFRLKATLVATTLLRPWRTGWSEDRGVDFSLVATERPAMAPTTTRDEALAAERACFIDEDWTTPPSAAVVRRFDSLAAAEAAIEPSAEDAPDTAGLRAWWSMSGKPSRT